MHFGQICISDLILVDREGNIVQGKDKMLNTAAFAIHSRLHEARSDVNAAAHSHSMYGKSFSTLGRLLEPITQDSCAFYDDHVLFDDYTGVVLETDEGDRIAEALERISPNTNSATAISGVVIDLKNFIFFFFK